MKTSPTTARSLRSHVVSIATAVICLPLTVALRGELREARAGEPGPVSKAGASAMPTIERIDGASGPPKAAVPAPATGRKVPACALAAYARLADERKTLEATYAGDAAGFDRAFVARKHALVGQAAMDAIGCKGGGP